MARGLNKVLLIGNIGNDPEIKYAPSGTAVATFNLATSENRKGRDGEWEEHTEWHKIVTFGKTADVCKNYLHKGSRIYVEGRLQTRSWEDNGGEKKYMTEIVADNLIMLDGKEESDTSATGKKTPGATSGAKQSSAQTRGPQPRRQTAPIPAAGIDDDLPF